MNDNDRSDAERLEHAMQALARAAVLDITKLRAAVEVTAAIVARLLAEKGQRP